MAAASPQDEPGKNFRVNFPEHATYSDHLIGRYPTIGPRRSEIRQRLSSYGITPNRFTEYATKTRYNRQYVKAISDKLGTWDTFKIEKASFSNATSDGQNVQAITSRPIRDEPSDDWLARTVQNFSPEDDSAAMFGAATVYMFQLYKMSNPVGTITQRNANWCCVTAAAEQVWEIPEEWVANRNARRNLPDVLECQRFRSIALRTDTTMEDTINRMVKNPR